MAGSLHHCWVHHPIVHWRCRFTTSSGSLLLKCSRMALRMPMPVILGLIVRLSHHALMTRVLGRPIICLLTASLMALSCRSSRALLILSLSLTSKLLLLHCSLLLALSLDSVWSIDLIDLDILVSEASTTRFSIDFKVIRVLHDLSR